MRRSIIAIVAFAYAAATAFGMDVKEGRMRLTLDEKTGRFALYYLEDAAKNKYAPLLYDQETRTTYATLSFDQKQYKLGDSPEFRVVSVKPDGAAARIEYRSSFAVVSQTFTFVKSPGATAADAISIRFDIENTSSRDAKVGLRYLFDTWLGEKQSAHFSIDGMGTASAETLVKADQAAAWIRSQAEQSIDPDKASLQIALSAPATKPDFAIAANWKRLNDAAWALDVNPSRNFTLLPYSINDSAVALYFEPQMLRPGASRTVATVLGESVEETSATVAQAAPQVLPQASGQAGATAIVQDSDPLDEMTDLVAARSLLEEINAALVSGAQLSAEELEALKSTLERLEARKDKY